MGAILDWVDVKSCKRYNFIPSHLKPGITKMELAINNFDTLYCFGDSLVILIVNPVELLSGNLL